MKLTALAVVIALAPLPLAAQSAGGITKAALAAAGRQATLKQIDYGEDYCDSAMTVEAWLKALVGKQARTIAWTGGDCVLVSDMRPGIDASKWAYCAQATITLTTPKNRKDVPVVEIYFEKPDHGRVGKAYAFRGALLSSDAEPEYIRFRRDFAALWDERFPPGPDVERCKND
jgi:hypothetical protein